MAQPLAPAAAIGEPWPATASKSDGSSQLGCRSAGLLAVVATLLLKASSTSRRRSARAARKTIALRAAEQEYGEDLAVPDDAFCVLGLAHCFEQVDGKLQDAFVLEPVT